VRSVAVEAGMILEYFNMNITTPKLREKMIVHGEEVVKFWSESVVIFL
jgi:hypothetical protein